MRSFKPELPERSRWRARLLLATPFILVLALFAVIVLKPYISYLTYEPREGDVLFQSLPHGALTAAIEGATESPWSHCGIVAREGDRWVVYEAYGSVRSVGLLEFWRRSRGGRIAVYRLTDDHQHHIPALLDRVRRYLGRPYDSHYDMDDAKIYCSELIFKAYRDVTGAEMGRIVRLGDLRWQPYERTIREIERGPVPLDRKMITPRHLSEAPQLSCVLGCGP